MAKREGFTLIELLVVIAVIALLMAILMPTLSRVRKQARAVACRANLGQWGIFYATYAAENDGHLPGWGDRPSNPGDPGWGWGFGWWGPWGGGPDRAKSQWYETTKGIMCCPMATKPANPTDQGDPSGGTFLAWGYEVSPGPWWYGHGSYGISGWVGWWYWSSDPDWRKLGWSTTDVKDAAAVPVLLDSCWPWGAPWGSDASWVPPASDAVPTRWPGGESPWNVFCINRHDGYVNGLFLDWSVRKVGLKELWMLKWNKEYKTRGFWTKAGGVKPEDWPAWMRKFKDY
jgi:prepilin-type N-terminal cleavage/methylation domain-containing protein/prepilin-type processing-associated H-X9-DG protein